MLHCDHKRRKAVGSKSGTAKHAHIRMSYLGNRVSLRSAYDKSKVKQGWILDVLCLSIRQLFTTSLDLQDLKWSYEQGNKSVVTCPGAHVVVVMLWKLHLVLACPHRSAFSGFSDRKILHLLVPKGNYGGWMGMAERFCIVSVQSSGDAREYRSIRRAGEPLAFQNSTPEQDFGKANSF